MQLIAREMNVSETSFLVGQTGRYNLRWFTPTSEVDLCGHATLAAAHALWTEWGEDAESIQFETLSGELVATRTESMIWLDFPSEPVELSDLPELSDAIGADVLTMGINRMDLLAEVASDEVVRSLGPDLALVAELGNRLDRRGLIVTARAEEGAGYDFISRFFAPGLGINEDPVTGSAHCALAPYWAGRVGRDELVGYQASERGGSVRVRLVGDRVHLGGEAVTVFTGQLKKAG